MSRHPSDLPPAERAKATSLRQGDLLRAAMLSLVTAPATSMHASELGSEAEERDNRAVEVELPTQLVAVVSGDCDLARDIALEPTFVVAPIVDIEDQRLYDAAHGGNGSSRVFSLPAAGALAEGPPALSRPAIDVRWLQTIEKTAILADGVEVIPCPLDSPIRDRLRLWLGRRFGRVGYPPDIQRFVVRPLVNAIVHPRQAHSEVGRLREAAIFYGVRWTEGSAVAAGLVVLDPALRAARRLDDGALRGAQRAIREQIRGRTGPYLLADLTIADADRITHLDTMGYRQFFLDPLDRAGGEYA